MTEPRIALVEDSAELREELLLFLHAKGLEAWAADSAESFWKKLHKRQTDIVIIDIGLPGEDGFSVIDFLRRLRRDYGLIVISARGGAQARQRGIALGADFYLVKPLNFAKLFETVGDLWQRLRATRAATEGDLIAGESGNAAGAGWQLSALGLLDPAGKCLPLTPREYRLVEALYQRRNEVCSKELLHDLLFGYEAAADLHRVDVIISRLRSKARRLDIPLDIRAIFGRGVVFLDGS